MTDFSDILQGAEQLAKDLVQPAELPKVSRSLGQVLDASSDLYSRVGQTSSKDIQANLLLGSKGVDLPKLVTKLETISTKRSLEPLEPINEINLQHVLQNEIQNKIIAAFDSGYSELIRSTYLNAWKHEKAEWKSEKLKILSAMGGNTGIPIEIRKYETVMVEKPSAPVARMETNQMIYVLRLIQYNKDIIREPASKPNLVKIFAEAANDFHDSKVKDLWELMKYMTNLTYFPKQEDCLKTRYTPKVVSLLIKQAKKYLEDRYKIYMTNIVNENLSKAERGGAPGVYHLAKSYVALRLKGEYIGLKDGMVDNRPLWPMVYYCIRAGDYEAALHCLKNSSASENNELTALLEAKLNNPLDPETAKRADAVGYVYRRYVRNESDPFKRIVFSVLSSTDINDDHSEVARTVDDYIWLQLNLVKIYMDDCSRYNQLQKLIVEEYGEEHYDGSKHPHLYFQVLLLTGQFEQALVFLTKTDKYEAHAVHMAIALNELGLLAVPHDTNAPLIFADPADPPPARRLNLVRLILIHVQTFTYSWLHETLQYFYQLRNFSDVEGENLFSVCFTNLAIESKEYEKLLGSVDENGVRSTGLIDQFANSKFIAAKLAETIGNKLVKKGLYEEAILVYEISKKEDLLLTFMNAMLSQVVQMPPEPDSLRSRLQQKAHILAKRFMKDGFNSSSSLVNSFLKLTDLCTFFDLFNQGHYTNALKAIDELCVIPLREDEVLERLNTFKSFSTDVCKIIPDVLLATMIMLHDKYQNVKQGLSVISDEEICSVEQEMAHYRLQAKMVLNFAGIIPFNISRDINNRIVQLEILMH